MFLINSRLTLFAVTMNPSRRKALQNHGTPSSEDTGQFCRVPSPELSRAPWITHPIHLWRFTVRSPHNLANRSFSRQPCISQLVGPKSAFPHVLSIMNRSFILQLCLQHGPGISIALGGLASCVTPSLKRSCGGAGIFTSFPSSTPLGLDLGSDSPWED